MRDGTALETQRLNLAPLEGADAGGLFDAFSDDEAMRFWDSPAHRYPDETREVVEALRRSAHGAWTLRLKARRAPAGLVYLLDAPTGEKMAAAFENDLAHAREIRLGPWRKRGWLHRSADRLARTLSPWL